MKSTLLLLLVVVAAVSAVEKEDFDSFRRSTLNLGVIGNQDRLLRSENFVRASMVSSWAHPLTLFAPTGTRINAIRAREVGASQSGSIRLTHGGLGSTFAAFDITNAAGRGLNYRVEIWGR
ncbi:uncharacterized protein LOC101739447 [Bombyx mori]|uniref:Salivary secreted peptide n=1 Tax=Bombyx mori TaxID=7091 RepID=A0A8R1WG80_BOMMO|nr:uncharacterized protein LOC101739447 [Bombyx mori]